MDPVLDTTLRIALALVFVQAALHKLRAPSQFRVTLAAYRLLPERATAVFSLAIAAAEVATALLLVLPAARTIAPWSALALLGVYSIVIGVNLARGRRDIDCGCAGPALRQPLSGWLLLRNAALAATALGGLLRVDPRPLLWIDGISIAGGVLVLALLYASANRLLATAPALARLRSA